MTQFKRASTASISAHLRLGASSATLSAEDRSEGGVRPVLGWKAQGGQTPDDGCGPMIEDDALAPRLDCEFHPDPLASGGRPPFGAKGIPTRASRADRPLPRRPCRNGWAGSAPDGEAHRGVRAYRADAWLVAGRRHRVHPRHRCASDAGRPADALYHNIGSSGSHWLMAMLREGAEFPRDGRDLCPPAVPLSADRSARGPGEGDLPAVGLSRASDGRNRRRC